MFAKQFEDNVSKYQGEYPVAIGSKLGNVKLEHISQGPSYWLGKKFYNLYCIKDKQEVMKIKGMPQTTINEDGSKRQVVDRGLYEETYNNAITNRKAPTRSFSTMKKQLWGKTFISTHEMERTVPLPKNAKEYKPFLRDVKSKLHHDSQPK